MLLHEVADLGLWTLRPAETETNLTAYLCGIPLNDVQWSLTQVNKLLFIRELHRTGRVRILATSGATRSPLLPDVPTFAEAGLAGIEGTAWFGIYAPAKTPEATVRQLNAAINKALASAELRERLTKLGLEPAGGSAADLAARMAQDSARWAPIVKASGFRAD